MSEPFSVDDLCSLSQQVEANWRAAREFDWDVPAGTLEWTCRETAAHVVDTMFAPAFFLASRRTHDYPNFGALAAPAGISVDDLADGLRAMTNMLAAVIEHAPVGTEAIIRRSPEVETGSPIDFAPRGALELAIHAHDIATGLGYVFVPDVDLAARLRDHTVDWPLGPPVPRTDDPWADLLARFGR